MIFNKDKHEQDFLALLVKLKPEAIIGLTKLLSVKVSDVDKETGEIHKHEADQIVSDLTCAFRKLPHKGRKIVLDAMRAESKKEVKEDGASTED